ncbi:kinase-like protein [Westerdykella ornata]|uniref:Kinase-like protein n=1 Tax=Westerdykella ornata TaxID=318751 RepID=A0A6A6JUY6_WESOR|nr:kinase-like protein [Westerdykella ornata]KAF2280402.1 kinase-like protein [Westerdykella ornata]
MRGTREIGGGRRVAVRRQVALIYCSHPKKPELDIHLATSANQFFVLNPVSRSVLDHLLEFNKEFGDNPYLRPHVFTTDVFSLVKNYSPLPLDARKTILREVCPGLRDMHARNWVHLGMLDNVFANWHIDRRGQFHLHKVALGDFDVALKLEDGKLFNHRIGNVMWRSPEGQLGKGVGKHSEVFSFGLLCFYVTTGVEWLHPDFETLEAVPVLVTLYKLLSPFGPLPHALVKHVKGAKSEELLKALWEAVAEDETNETFDTPSVFRMTNLDPVKRVSMSEIMADPYWNLEDVD